MAIAAPRRDTISADTDIRAILAKLFCLQQGINPWTPECHVGGARARARGMHPKSVFCVGVTVVEEDPILRHRPGTIG